MRLYTFQQCTLTQLDRDFGLQQVLSTPMFEQWIQAEIEISDFEKSNLTYYQSLLELNVSAWYEQDLSMQFIGPVLGLVQFTDRYKYNLFAGRKIQAVLAGVDEEIELSGEPDGLLATGYREPKIPMFAFTEYKKANDPSGEPPGQTLAAMLVGQHLNQTLKNTTGPIYGAYIIGGEWWFMLLQDKEYVISRAYTALGSDLFEIFRILKSLKKIVIDLTK